MTCLPRSLALSPSPFESQPLSNTCRCDRAEEKDGERVEKALWAGNDLVVLQLLGQALSK